MSKSLTLSAALAPLCALALGDAASAATINTATTAPVATATATNGAPDNLLLDTAGSITLPAAGPAITLNSNNTVTQNGAITTTDVNGSVGVLILGGNTGSYLGATSSTITFNETYAPTDTINADGIVEAPFAAGAGRFAIRLTGPGTFTGNITSGGSISVKGNNSYGLSIEAPLTGSISIAGVTLQGDNGAAVNIAGPVAGNVQLTGAVSVVGSNSVGLSVTAPVTGRVSILSSVATTGYSTNVRPQVATALALIQATPQDVQQGGAAAVIAANVGGGIYVSAPPLGTVSGSIADVDGDGAADGSETTGQLTSIGSAPALLIGAAGQTINIGAFGTGSNAYGLMMRGSINANGQYDTFSSTGIQIGLSGGKAILAGGASIFGSVAASAYSANATAMYITGNSVVPQVRIDGSLSGQVLASTSAVTAYGLAIDAGSTVNNLTLTGGITAAAVGDTANAVAVVDRSGTLTTVVNQGNIVTGLTPVTAATPGGSTIALDLRANTTGVSFVQQTNPSPNLTYGSVSGAVDTAVATITAVTPTISGDILLGSGPNSVQLLAGTIAGNLNFGSGTAASSFLIDNAATFIGTLAHGAGPLSINVNNGVLQNTSTATLGLSTLTLGAASTLIITADPANNVATRYSATGPVSIGNGAQFGVALKSLLQGPQSYTIISSPNLTSTGGANLITAIPYLYQATLAVTPAAGTVTLGLRRKTATEMGLNRSEAAAANAIYAALPNDTTLQSAVLSQQNYAGLASIYDQLLPEHSGAAFFSAQMAAEAIAKSAGEPDTAEAGGMWASEIAYGMQDSKGAASAYRSSGFGLVGGLEADSNIGAVGLTAAFVTGRTLDNTLPGNNLLSVTQLQAGLYWRSQWKGLTLDASGSGGYASFKSTRQLMLPDATTGVNTVIRANKASWGGYSLQGRFGVAYEMRQGRFYLRPQAHADYFRLHENAHTENSGNAAFDLAFDDRNGSALSATASIVAGMTFGSQVKWRPQIEFGYRTVASGQAGDTVVRFAGGSSFTLEPNAATGSGPIANIALVADADYLRLVLEAGAQMRKKVASGNVRATVRMKF